MEEFTFVNLTPHDIVVELSNKDRLTFLRSGEVARVTSHTTECPPLNGIPSHKTVWGEIEGLPEPVKGTIYIVSLFVIQHPSVKDRDDVVSPGTGPKDGCIRNDAGQVEAVTRFNRPS